MELRCSPRNTLLLVGLLGMLFFCSQPVSAQCKGEFTFQSISTEKGSDSGKIEVSIQNPAAGAYTFTVYEMNGAMTLVETKQASSPNKITFENLKASTYFVKVEWGQSCRQVLGGFDGIIITEKDQGR